MAEDSAWLVGMQVVQKLARRALLAVGVHPAHGHFKASWRWLVSVSGPPRRSRLRHEHILVEVGCGAPASVCGDGDAALKISSRSVGFGHPGKGGKQTWGLAGQVSSEGPAYFKKLFSSTTAT
jgi:hypothetical protein